MKNQIKTLHESRATLAPPQWLVEDYIETGTLTSVIAPPASYKSFFALDLAASVATGTPFHGNLTKKGRVLYLVGEGLRGFHQRAQAWETHHGLPLEDFDVQENTFKFQDPAACADFLIDLQDRSLKSVAAKGPSLKPDLIIIDTLARYSAGVEENSAKEIGILIENISSFLVKQNDIAVIIIHHSGRQGTHSRGSSAVDGAVDFEYRLAADRSTKTLSVTASKVKDHEPFPTRCYQLDSVPVHEKTTKTSLVLTGLVENASGFKAVVDSKKMSAAQKKIYDTVVSLIPTRPKGDLLHLTPDDLLATNGTIPKKNYPRTLTSLFVYLGGLQDQYSFEGLISSVYYDHNKESIK